MEREREEKRATLYLRSTTYKVLPGVLPDMLGMEHVRPNHHKPPAKGGGREETGKTGGQVRATSAGGKRSGGKVTGLVHVFFSFNLTD